MITTIQMSPLSFVNNCLRYLACLCQGKPPIEPDELVLEHLLIYHSLVGSTPVNLQVFKDVRADIISAVQRRDSLSLAIALKLPPLSWEEQLKTICAEIKTTDLAALVETLLPAHKTSDTASNDLLSNDDWTVRANVANLLGYLKIEESVPRLVQALESSRAGMAKPAFPYIAMSLAHIGTDNAKAALVSCLSSSEPWFVVDAVRSLTLWPLSGVADELSNAMLVPHHLSDYMAVAIARRYSIIELLQHPTPTVGQCALEVVIGVIKASSSTYGANVVENTKVYLGWPFIKEGLNTHPTPRQIKASLELSRWLESNLPSFDPALPATSHQLTADHLGHVVLASLQWHKPSTQDSQVRHAIELAGELHLTLAVPKLIDLLESKSAFLNETIESLGKLGDACAAQALVSLGSQLVNLAERSARPASAHAVTEVDPDSAYSYWLILKALGQLRTSMSWPFLLQATNDFAADKRMQALSSTIHLCSSVTPDKQTKEQIIKAVAQGLRDPNLGVRQVAIAGVQSLGLIEFLPDILTISCSREVSLRNQAFQALQSLAQSGHSKAVLKATKQRLAWELNQDKRNRFVSFLDCLK